MEIGFGQPQGTASDILNKMAWEIRKVAKETLEKSRVFGFMGKQLWWSNESIHSKVRVKMFVLKNWLGVKMPKLGKSIRKLRIRSRRRWVKKETKLLMNYTNP